MLTKINYVQCVILTNRIQKILNQFYLFLLLIHPSFTFHSICLRLHTFSFIVTLYLAYTYIDDCTINNNPIAASTRVSALNIVADLLKKLDVSSLNIPLIKKNHKKSFCSYIYFLHLIESRSKAKVMEDTKITITEIY